MAEPQPVSDLPTRTPGSGGYAVGGCALSKAVNVVDLCNRARDHLP